MTDRIEGLSIGLDLDSVKVESGLKDLNKKLALVNSEMKALNNFIIKKSF